jgi:transcriptional regulator of acetoin/glycerol metabolism
MMLVDFTDTLDIGGPAAGPPPGAGLVTLFASDPAVVPCAIPLPGRALILGRSPPPGELVLPSTSISRVHARVAVRGAEIVVDDLESRNGTFVNGARIQTAVVTHGDEIRVGDVVFKVVTSDAEGYAAFPLSGIVPAAPLSALRGGLAIERVRREIALTARADLSVLVLGETGTGKELVARALHDVSGRAGRFCPVNCAAIPPTLLESELFGYKRGAFTGADRDRSGIVKTAHGGTLFLDEIGDIPVEAQAKILRMIETRSVTPLGGAVAEPVDLRLVCATHRPLPQLVREDKFRADLYARISGHTILLPPLRERKEDIYQLAHEFLSRSGKESEPPRRVNAAFMIGLIGYDWPFNVRELEAAMKRAVALAQESDEIGEAHLPEAIREHAVNAGRPAASAAAAAAKRSGPPSAEELRAAFERHGGNLAAVARELGKDRTQVHRWLRHHGLSPDDFRSR